MNVNQAQELNREDKSRTEHSARNTTAAVIGRMLAILLGFISRVVFTHTLSTDYVGINGLFTDILNVLALSELGVGTAITYALYKPIAEKNIEKQKSLMQMYKMFYRIVAGIVCVAGLLVIPFMDILIKDQPAVDHLTLIYLMYLANSVVSYLLIYKKTLIDAHQLSYITVLYQMAFQVLHNALQIVVLLVTKNYILYLSMLIICTIAGNICISRKADKMYPYLKDKNVEPLAKEEKGDIFRNIRAMLMHKVGNVIVNNTDNLLLSALVGTLSVGRYSNYFLVIGSVRQVLNQVFQGITASVGNMGVEESKERIHKIFDASFFVGQWMFGVATICLYEAVDLFVGISFGEQYVFPVNVTLILCLNFYLTGMRQATLVFRDSMGLFRYDRYKSLAEAAINLVVSLILGHYYGTTGVFLGTMISTITTSLWVEPYVLYKYRLQSSCVPYFVKYGLYASVTLLAGIGVHWLCGLVGGNVWVMCFGRMVISFVVVNLVYLVLYHRTKEFRLLMQKGLEILRKKTKEVESEHGFGPENELLLKLLKESLADKKSEYKGVIGETETSVDWNKWLVMSKRHSVLSLLYPVCEETKGVIPESIQNAVQKEAIGITKQSYRLLFLSKYLTTKIREAGISVVLLKGVATAFFYPVPEYRKSGDVDLLLTDSSKLEECCAILEKCGCIRKSRQDALHHVAFIAEGGIEVELHTLLAEPYDNRKINKYLERLVPECANQVRETKIMGVNLPILNSGYHGYELLLHMLQHFLRAGFGLKFLCDWVVFWSREHSVEECALYLRLIRESGMKGFSDMVTMTCCQYLGLSEASVVWMELGQDYDTEEFMREVLEAEEFGHSTADRMVAMRGNGIWDYVREFHHQMRLNFPRAGKCFLWWPVLWIVTLVNFMKNNQKVRNVSTKAIFDKAAQRSKIIRQMKLWKS